MTTKAKKTENKKPRKKLALNKQTLRDLSFGDKAKAVRGGVQQVAPGNEHCYTTFGTLA